jgi:hypothetical protein
LPSTERGAIPSRRASSIFRSSPLLLLEALFQRHHLLSGQPPLPTLPLELRRAATTATTTYPEKIEIFTTTLGGSSHITQLEVRRASNNSTTTIGSPPTTTAT